MESQGLRYSRSRHLGRLLPWLFSFTGLGLGFWGFGLVSLDATALTRLYLTLQLLVLESGAVEGPLPLQLEVARWLAPTATVWGLLIWFSTSARERLDAFRVQWMVRGHAILLSEGNESNVLALDLIRRRVPVVLLQRSGDSPMNVPGAVRLPAENWDLERLRSLGLQRASFFLASTEDDEDNLAIALGVHGIGYSGLQVLARVEDPRLAEVASRAGLVRDGDTSSVRTFNHHINAARGLLLRLPLQMLPRDGQGERIASEVHAVISDASRQSEALFLQLARTAHLPRTGHLRLHIIHEGASDFARRIVDRHPNIGQCLAIEVHDVPENLFSHRLIKAIRASGPDETWTIFPEFADRPDSIARVLELSAGLDEREFRRLRVVLEGQPERTDTLGWLRVHPRFAPSLHFIPAPESFRGSEAILRGALDLSARCIHESWLKGEQARQARAEALGDHETSERIRRKSAFVPWDQLSEDHRDANRGQADALWTYLRFAAHSAGRTALIQAFDRLLEALDDRLEPKVPKAVIEAILEVIDEEWRQLSDALIEEMAEAEHRRWAAHLWLGGWTHGPERDDARRIHPDLIAYEELSEATKQYDRDAIHAVPASARTVLVEWPAETRVKMSSRS